MAKRRTRKQKEEAKHTFSVTWDQPKARDKEKTTDAHKLPAKTVKAKSMNMQSMAVIKKDLMKSVIVFLIIMSALVAYSLLR